MFRRASAAASSMVGIPTNLSTFGGTWRFLLLFNCRCFLNENQQSARRVVQNAAPPIFSGRKGPDSGLPFREYLGDGLSGAGAAALNSTVTTLRRRSMRHENRRSKVLAASGRLQRDQQGHSQSSGHYCDRYSVRAVGQEPVQLPAHATNRREILFLINQIVVIRSSAVGFNSIVTSLYSSNKPALCICQAIGPTLPAVASLKSSTSTALLPGG